jgi:excinuclease UvrABC nuclease subunit
MMDLSKLPSEAIHNRIALPNDSVVYFVTGPDYVPLYIGESVRLKNRWEAHAKKAPAVALGADRILWLQVDGYDERLALEDRLIRLYDPVLNLKHRPRKPRKRQPAPPAPRP